MTCAPYRLELILLRPIRASIDEKQHKRARRPRVLLVSTVLITNHLVFAAIW